MASRKKTSTLTGLVVTHTLATAKPSTCDAAHGALVTKFGASFAVAADVTNAPAEGCKRLPRHSGEHKSAKPRGLMTPAQRKASLVSRAKPKAAKAAKPQTVVIDGVTYRVGPKVQPKAAVVTVLPEAEAPRQVAAARKTTKSSRPVSDPTGNAAVRRASRVTKTVAASA